MPQTSNEQHWENIILKAERAGWKDFHLLFDPIFYTRHGIAQKGFYRRIFQVPLLVALYGDDMVETGEYDKELNPVVLPRYHAIARQAVDMMMRQEPESVLAFLDAIPTQNELDARSQVLPQTDEIPSSKA